MEKASGLTSVAAWTSLPKRRDLRTIVGQVDPRSDATLDRGLGAQAEALVNGWACANAATDSFAHAAADLVKLRKLVMPCMLDVKSISANHERQVGAN
jgi:hypothetical protein